MENDRLAHRIRAFRKLKGYTQLELAKKMGLSVAILGAVERGTRRPDLRFMKKISKVLQRELSELMDYQNQERESR